MNKSIDIKSNKQIFNVIILGISRFLKLITLIIVLIILTLGFFLIIKPAYKDMINASDYAVEETDSEYSEKEAYLKKLKELEVKYEKITDSDIKKIEALAPHENKHEKLILIMEKIVSDNGLILSSISLSAEEQAVNNAGVKNDNAEAPEESGAAIQPVVSAGAGQIKKIKISLGIIGTDYAGFKNILNVFENSSRLFDITSLSFDGNSRRTSFDGYVYYMN